MRELTIKTTEEEKIITIIRGVEKEKLIPLAEALYDGGFRMLELTYDAKGILPDVENAKNIKQIATNIAPIESPKTVPNAVCARLVFVSIVVISP